jgi:long-chain acyl-CoA synthetase
MESRDYRADRTPVPTGTLTELFLDSVERFGQRIAYRSLAREGMEGKLTFRRVFEEVWSVALALEGMGLRRGDRVAILFDSCIEWSLLDFGCLCAGMPLVPIHSSLPASQVTYVLRDSGARVIFTSSDEQLEKVRAAAASCPDLTGMVVFDRGPGRPGELLGWGAFLEDGRRRRARSSEAEFRRRMRRTAPADAATILYTSGTTGDPKGVVLTHDNLFSNVRAVTQIVPVDETDVTLSFLPLSHVLQRMVNFLFFSRGSTIAFARSMETVAEDLRAARPTIVVAPPRFYEKTYQKVMEDRGLRGWMVRWAREVGEAWADEQLEGREPTWILRLVHRLAHRLVFRRIHQGLGGRIRFFISGSAPLAPEINKFFLSTGILILEGYGMTEASPVVSVGRPDDFQIGTVGPPIPGTEVRIAEDGEILVRGPQVMAGYFNRPEETARVITADRWLHTGDVGEIDERGHLRITDRKKNILVTAGGKNIAPAPIENRIKGNRYVDEVVMIGDRRRFPALLVVPAFEALEPWARAAGIRAETRRHLLAHPHVQEHLHREVFSCLSDLASFEMPKKLGLVEEEFTIEGGTLTPNQKVIRRAVGERFGGLIDTLYNPANLDRTVFVNGE